MLSIHNSIPTSFVTRQIGIASRTQSSAMEKLSSGFRINKAADDPSGLLISEKLESQIESLQRALQNTEEAANIKDIMDGGLSQIQDVLKELQQLAIHSANRGVTTAEQIAADQAQMDSGLLAINKIIETTNAGGKKLLEGMDSLFQSSSAPENGINPIEDQVDTHTVLGGNISFVINSPSDSNDSSSDSGKRLATLQFNKGQTYDDILNTLKELDLGALSELEAEGDDDFSGRTLSMTTNGIEELLRKPDDEAKEYLYNLVSGTDKSGGSLIGELISDKSSRDDYDYDGNLTISDGNLQELSDADKSRLELANTLSNLNSGTLGTISDGGSKEYSLQDLASGGDASLRRDPVLALKILKESHKQVSNVRAQLAASRVYDDHANEASLIELENLTKASSGIRDADFASTVTEYSMATIQAEVGTKMLSSLVEQSRMVLNLFA